jgi:hypothetical protein
LLLGLPQRGADRLALSGDLVDQTCGIEQRCCLIEELLGVESDFKALLIEACPGAGIRCAPYSRGNKDSPLSRTVERAGRILCRPILGGLHHKYVRI